MAATVPLHELREKLGRPLSAEGVAAVRVIDDLVADVAGGLLGSAGGRFYGWVIGGAAATGQQVTDLGHLFDRASNVFSLTGALVAPLLDGGTLRSEQRAAVDAMRASAANYEQTVLVAFGQVADTLQALDHGAEQLEAQLRAQDAARDNVDLTRKSYNEGNVGLLQVLDAECLYQQARLGFVRARAQRYMDTATLFLALGGSGPDAVASNGGVADLSPRR